MFLLDAGTCFALLDGSAAVRRHLRAHEPSAVRLSALAKAELLRRARESDDVAAHLELLNRFFLPFSSLVFDDRCAEHYALLRAQAASADPGDLSISDFMQASVALVHDLTLVTTRPAAFAAVAGLPVEDWTRETV